MKPTLPCLLHQWTIILLFFNGFAVDAQERHSEILVTLKGKNMMLEDVFNQIRSQTGVSFSYSRSAINVKERLTAAFELKPLAYVLDHLPLTLPLAWTYEPQWKRVTLTGYRDGVKPMISKNSRVSGRAVDSAGVALPGTAIRVKGSRKFTEADENGNFVLPDVPEHAVIEASIVGYYPTEMAVTAEPLLMVLKETERLLDGTIVYAYGTTSRRDNTGNIGQMKAVELEKQPVSNPLAALEGRIAGLQVTQRSGNPGGNIDVLLRGPTSIGALGLPFTKPISNTPLYVIDGVPFAPGSGVVSNKEEEEIFKNGISPLAVMNLADVESIEVLKDADATAIYGSRGANGVIILTTKKGQAGKVRIGLRLSGGYSQLLNRLKLMNTSQYLGMLREAFANDGEPVSGDAFDVFDPNRYTDFNKLLLQRPAYQSDAQLNLSFGDMRTQFLAGVGYSSETVTYAHAPGKTKFGAYRPSFHVNVNHTSLNEKFKLNINMLYATFRGTLAGRKPFDMSTFFEPNYPSFLDANSNLVWDYKGVPIANAYATLYNEYRGKPDNFSTGLTTSYQLTPKLKFAAAAGYNAYIVNESELIPMKSKSPVSNETNSATIRDASIKTYIVEPRLEYVTKAGPGRLQVMVGTTWQQSRTGAVLLKGSNFMPDDLYGFLASPQRTIVRTGGEYRYEALYARINYNIKHKYILNLSGNRDASSRFAPGRRYSNFGAAGAAWVFQLPFISFGKLRASAGVTGNDGIGNYQYMSTFTSASAYQGESSLVPATPFNNTYRWEKTVKMEAGLDLGFFRNRLLVALALYRSRTGNQLLQQPIAGQTGFTSIMGNFPATVQNKGLELELSGILVKHKNWEWTSSFNISINKNKLIAFPSLEGSAYAQTLTIGQPITVVRGFRAKGVNPKTGLFEVEDRDGNGLFNQLDYTCIGNVAPLYYGGLQQELVIKKDWKFSVFFSFKKQIGLNALSEFPSPATHANAPAYFLGKFWQHPDDIAEMQKLTQNIGSPAYTAGQLLLTKSDAIYSDASYIRVKNIQLLHTFRKGWFTNYNMETIALFIQAQNFFTITRYKGVDPENPQFKQLPPVRSLSVGINVNFK